ncbi:MULTISPECIES: hypothetical protein [unclassified Janthinobacterium]|uniref:hypothetical protein n=1 Tax=unclassified Janthinobacterium TaxID=2610881 RepID=UPI001618045E|nr:MULTISPECIES: hypothetical protein [unclassified Janthinobacterium]MBB5607743.1 hypothetical protein [Janthinobacterium sp. S3T4]MBB5613108.1 hypothetical protein [Janthinobacterium sp. S3M3]
MKKISTTVVFAGAVLAMAMLQGCATRVKASATNNPAPSEAFSSYGRIQVKPTVFAQGYTGNPAALAKIEENIHKDMAESLTQWNARPDNGRVLIIEPIVEEIQFTAGAKRVLLGPLAGSSGVRMRVLIHDDKGVTVATPEFFQRAGAMAAGFMFGVHDNLMLTRVANLSSSYIKANYVRAEGGPTGADDKSLGATN